MRAFRLVEPRKFELVELPDPVIGDGQALVRLRETAVCGSDMLSYLGTLPTTRYPLNVGDPCHECVGDIIESKLDGYRPGDRVMFFPPGTGGLAELGVAPSAERVLHLPEGNLTELLVGQLLGTVIHAARELGDVMSARVAVVGQGPAGQLFSHLMWNLGARMIIAIDKVPERVAVSPRMRATHALQVGRDDVVERVKELTSGRGADVVIEAAGYDETIDLMVELVRRHGKMLLFGAAKHLRVSYPVRTMMGKRASLFTAAGPDIELDTRQALDYIADGRIDVKPILTHRIPFERAPEAYELFAERKDGCIKVILDYGTRR